MIIHDYDNSSPIVKWLQLWNDFNYEMTSIMRWLQLWDDFNYEMTSIMRWLQTWDDFNCEIFLIIINRRSIFQ